MVQCHAVSPLSKFYQDQTGAPLVTSDVVDQHETPAVLLCYDFSVSLCYCPHRDPN